MARKNPPLTDAEIERKFEVKRGTPEFECAKRISRSRPDRTLCKLPELTCPGCGEEFTATYHDISGGNDTVIGNEIPCPECDRSMYVEHAEIADEDDPESDVFVTLTWTPPED